MSLIEQAAKRLEELRRAGAELPEKPGASGNATPTPEALVRVLDARGALESIVSPAGRPAPRDERDARQGPSRSGLTATFVLDLDRIKKWPDSSRPMRRDRRLPTNFVSSSGRSFETRWVRVALHDAERQPRHGHELRFPAKARRSRRSISR